MSHALIHSCTWHACRNVTITGAQGLDTVLDLDFVAAAVQLCPTCSVTFKNITVANERHGVGEAVDFISGLPDSSSSSSSSAAVRFVDANKLRLACTDAAAAAAMLQDAPRSTGAKQQALLQDYMFQVIQWHAALQSISEPEIWHHYQQ
jgi:hypothetical protein